MVDIPRPTNENTSLWQPGDVDRAFVADTVREMFDKFKRANVSPLMVSAIVISEFMRYVPGNPFTKDPDEADIRAGMGCIDPAAMSLQTRSEAYLRAFNRLHLRRMEKLARKWGCSVEEAFERWNRERCEEPAEPQAE